MSFSFTAPMFTADDELNEMSRLSPEERAEISADLYGSTVSVDMPHSALNELVTRMKSFIEEVPTNEKQAYLEAVERCPKLVATEPEPMAFLRAEDLDAKAAALRCVKCWEWRKKLFGPEHAFTPLTREFALSDENDLSTLRQGLIEILPEDEFGRLVVHVNRTSMHSDVAFRSSILRVFFFLMCRLSYSPEVQKVGIVVLKNMKDYNLYKHFDRTLTKSYSQLLTEVLPVKLRAHHIMNNSRHSDTLVFPVIKQLLGRYIRLRTVVHLGGELKLIRSLAEYGITAASLPKSCGGAFKREDFLKWLHDQESGSYEDFLHVRHVAVTRTEPGARKNGAA